MLKNHRPQNNKNQTKTAEISFSTRGWPVVAVIVVWGAVWREKSIIYVLSALVLAPSTSEVLALVPP